MLPGVTAEGQTPGALLARDLPRPTGRPGRPPPSAAFVIALLTVALTTGCSGRGAPRKNLDGENTSPMGSRIDPQERLHALGQAWFRTSATITYRATAPVPGQPASTHQCLRQLVSDVTDRQAALRKCSRQGEVKLTWDPPDRWRMDVASPVGRFRILSTPGGSVLCAAAAEGNPPCRSISTREAKMSSPFGFVLSTPDEILHRLGALADAVDTSPETEVHGHDVECFHATGPGGHVEWCYSRDGLLLSFLRGSATGGWTTLEAVAVSDQVFEGDFDFPAS